MSIVVFGLCWYLIGLFIYQSTIFSLNYVKAWDSTNTVTVGDVLFGLIVGVFGPIALVFTIAFLAFVANVNGWFDIAVYDSNKDEK